MIENKPQVPVILYNYYVAAALQGERNPDQVVQAAVWDRIDDKGDYRCNDLDKNLFRTFLTVAGEPIGEPPIYLVYGGRLIRDIVGYGTSREAALIKAINLIKERATKHSKERSIPIGNPEVLEKKLEELQAQLSGLEVTAQSAR